MNLKAVAIVTIDVETACDNFVKITLPGREGTLYPVKNYSEESLSNVIRQLEELADQLTVGTGVQHTVSVCDNIADILGW